MAPGEYRFVSRASAASSAHHYRLGHPLADFLITQAAERELNPRELVFDYAANSGGKVSLVQDLIGQTGWLVLHRLTVEALEREDHLLFAAVTDDGTVLEQEKLMFIPARSGETVQIPATARETLAASLEAGQSKVLSGITERNAHFFNDEMEKLERWADDLKYGLEQELKDLDFRI